MSVFAVTMVKNEEDIIFYTIEHMLTQVERVIVADNMSTDKTRDLLNSIGESRLTIVDDFDPAYEQSRKMTTLALQARALGADHVVPFDADEYWYAPEFDTIEEAINQSPAKIFPATMSNFVPTSKDDQKEKNPFKRIQWKRKENNPLVKVAGRTWPGMVVEQGNHNITYPEGFEHGWEENLLAVRHYPYRSEEQFVNKAIQGNAALALTNLPYESGQHWRDYAALANSKGRQALVDVYLEWFHSDNPRKDGLVHEPVKNIHKPSGVPRA